MPYSGFTPGSGAGLYYDPEALRRSQQARQQQQMAFQAMGQAGKSVFGSSFSVNPQGVPMFGPTTGNIYQEGLFYQYPSGAVTQRLGEMGFTTHRSNPFVGYALSLAEGLPTLWNIISDPSQDTESMMAGFTALAQSIPQVLLGSPSALAGTPLSRRSVGQALRNFNMANMLGEATPDNPLDLARTEASMVRDLIANLGSLWFTPMWRNVALYDLQQKFDDYVRYVATNPGQAIDFIQFLVDTGFVDRYFG
jgi:hypothetical protein